MSSLSLRHIYKVYAGGVRAVSDFNLDIDDKEFIVFVGPSGCGKSTTLRMIAGLEDISSGELYIDGKLVNDVEPKDRDIAMVFQSYALYPHMTLYDNMAFGLRLRHVPEKIIDEKVQEAASVLGIQHLLGRRPKALSGGQRQRVALGRAIVREPKVFLLDEPLSNLDAKLRVQMRTEITKIHHRLATTFIYVTHDQTEAMTMGTRIVVMKDGIVQQVDTPATLYDNPANLFVACFLGSPQMNVFKAKLVEEGGNLYALIGERNKVMIPKARALRIIDKNIIGSEVLLGIRPEDVRYEKALVEAHPESVIEATVDVIENLGNETILYLNIDGKDDYTIARVGARDSFKQGDVVKMYFATEHAHLFDATTEYTLMGVPDYNLIPAQAIAVDGKLAIMFGDVRIDLPESVLERITDKSIINNGILLGIPPKAFKAECGEGDVCIDGASEFFDDYPRFKAVYLSVPGLTNKVIVERPLDYKFESGASVKAYVNPDDIQLFNSDGERIVALNPVTGNSSNCVVTHENGVFGYSLCGKNGTKLKLSFAGNAHHAVTAEPKPMHIVSRGFSIDKADVEKRPKMVITGIIKNLDEYRKDAVVTVGADGFDGDVTAVIRDFSGYNVGDTIKLAVDPSALIVSKYVPFASVVASKDVQAAGVLKYKNFVQTREREREIEQKSKPAAKIAKPEPVEPAPKKSAESKPKAEVKRPTAKKK